MWILTPSLMSRFAAATGASTSASSEQLAEAFAQSLMWRSSRSRSPIWLQRLRKNSWTKHLSGAICDPSLGESFTDWWTSCLAATHANHSAQPASDLELKTPDTSGRTYQPELLSCDQVSVSLRTSRDISALGFPTCCKTWQEWVTERRGAYSARVKLVRLTKERGSLFWPSVVVSEVRQGFQDRSRGMKGSQESLTTAVILHGQAAPASSSSLGSRQGLSWATPRANERDGTRTPNGNPRKDGIPLGMQAKQWATPSACDHKGATSPDACKKWEHRGQNLPEMVVGNWATPQAKDHKSGHRDPTIVQYKQLNVEVEAKATGKLNPRWVETLMGLPIGWTMPSCTSPQTIARMSCGSSAMELCQPPQSELSEFSLAS